MNNNDVHITRKEFDELKLIGEGTDAKVYRVNKDILYKVYHTRTVEKVALCKNDEDIKLVTNIKAVKIINQELQPLDYVDKYGVRVSREDAVNRAIEKQQNIQLSSLPMGNLYINDRFSGCILKAHNFCMQMHTAKAFPLKLRLKIMRELLLEVDELLENYVYPIDLANKPISEKTHSNVLITPSLHPQIIDLDGKSTVYKEVYDRNNYIRSLLNLKILLLDVLCDIDYEDLMDHEDMEFNLYRYKDDKLTSQLIKELSNSETTIEKLKTIIK